MKGAYTDGGVFATIKDVPERKMGLYLILAITVNFKLNETVLAR